MKRPLCIILLFYIMGVIAAQYFPQAIIFSVFSALLLYFHYKQYIILTFPLISVLGFALFLNQLTSNSSALIAVGENNVAVSGYVSDISVSASGRQKIIIDVLKIGYGDETTYYNSLKIHAILKENDTVLPGQAVTAYGAVLPLDHARNPGGFNEFQYMRSKWVHYKMFPDSIHVGGIRNNFSVFLLNIRIKAAEIFDGLLPETEAGIMKAITLGDTSGLSSETRLLYSDAGAYHILAVSGLHLSILSQMISLLLKKLKLPRTKAGVITLIFLISYCILTGAGSATVRATIMCSALVIGEIISKDRDGATTISFAALCLLVYSPMKLFDYGFLYSFFTVYGFVFGGAAYENFILFLKAKAKSIKAQKLLKTNFINKNAASSVIASFAIYPLCAYFSYKLPVFGVLLNIVIAPSVVLIVVSGFLMLIAGFVNTLPALPFAGVAFCLLKLYEILCNLGRWLPLALIQTGKPHILIIIGCYVVLGIIVYCYSWNNSGIKFKKPITTASIAAYAVIVLIYNAAPKPFTVTMLDVSQGDSAVANIGGTTIIIDGGGLYNSQIGSGTGTNILIPYLNYLGVETVSAAFVTHTDIDHAFGVIETLMSKKVKKLFLPVTVLNGSGDSIYEMLLESAETHNTEVYYIKAGDTVEFQTGVTIECLYPFAGSAETGNEGSIALKMSYSGTSFLFTGDIGFESERSIINNLTETGKLGILETDLLKVAHHGSKYSTSSEFLDAANPKVALVSAGRDNPYGHPTQEVLDKLNEIGCTVFTTPENGAITVTVFNGKFGVKTMIK